MVPNRSRPTVSTRHQHHETGKVLRRAHLTLAAWKRESVTDEPAGDFGRSLAQARRISVSRGVVSRVPRWWWGRGGERVLALMREQRRKLREKG